jgi:hypothetical protein
MALFFANPTQRHWLTIHMVGGCRVRGGLPATEDDMFRGGETETFVKDGKTYTIVPCGHCVKRYAKMVKENDGVRLT